MGAGWQQGCTRVTHTCIYCTSYTPCGKGKGGLGAQAGMPLWAEGRTAVEGRQKAVVVGRQTEGANRNPIEQFRKLPHNEGLLASAPAGRLPAAAAAAGHQLARM